MLNKEKRMRVRERISHLEDLYLSRSLKLSDETSFKSIQSVDWLIILPNVSISAEIKTVVSHPPSGAGFPDGVRVSSVNITYLQLGLLERESLQKRICVSYGKLKDESRKQIMIVNEVSVWEEKLGICLIENSLNHKNITRVWAINKNSKHNQLK